MVKRRPNTRFVHFPARRLLVAALVCCLIPAFSPPPAAAQESSAYYRLLTFESPRGLNLEASGLAVLPDGKLAVAIRRGEVWIIDNPTAEPPTVENLGYRLFASGMHELLGLAWHEGALYATQRAEVTRLRDTDGDGLADEYLAAAHGWGVSGAYHEYAYGPVFDKEGNMHNTLNSSMGKKWKGTGGEEAEKPAWRGWSVITPKGGTTPHGFSAGFRSPSGIGLNAQGDIFATDQQGNYWGTNPLVHIRKGAFFGHAEALADTTRPDSPVKHPGKLPEGITVAQLVKTLPHYSPPALWFPYVKMGQSPTGIRCDLTGGKFGPFAEQLFIGEFVIAGVNRVYLEKVRGEYQGACFPFVTGLQCAAMTLNFLADGSLVVGQTNRGWNSSGNRPFGIQRLIWTGKTPLEIQRVNLQPDGFRFTFTLPVDPHSAKWADMQAKSYTYTYTSKYGSPEVDTAALSLTHFEWSGGGRELFIRCAPLREGYVHEFVFPELKAADGTPLSHRDCYYTLNRLPPAAKP